MAKIVVGKEGQIYLPESYRHHHGIEPGTALIFEPSESGPQLHFVRPDVQRVYIEASTVCNLNCAMCIRLEWRDPQGDMTADTFQAAFEGLRDFPNLKRVVFGGYGEPLMHPDIVAMVSQIRTLGVGLTLITNGTLLKPPLAEALIQAGIDTLVVSLDSMHIQAYQQAGLMSGVNHVLENLQGIRGLIRDRGWKLPVLGLEYVATKSNLEQLYRIPDIARQVGASFLIVNNLLPHSPELADEILYDRDELLQLGGGWGMHRAGWIEWGMPKPPRMKWGAARNCRFVNERSLTIGWDGGVSPCAALMHSYSYYVYGRRKEVTRYVLGFVRGQSLANIWTSEEYVTFRARVRDFRFPSCVDCGIDCSFAQENNDCWGNEPSCADCLWAQGIIHCP